jgi:hypothetical protein
LFDDHGCEICRHSWERDATIDEVVCFSSQLQTHLYRCRACGTFWEERGNWIAEVSARRALTVIKTRDLLPMPSRGPDGRFVIGDTVTEGYGRLLPLLNVFRADERYEVTERQPLPGSRGATGLRVFTVRGPWTPTDVEERFILPDDMQFRRIDQYLAWVSDPDRPLNSYIVADIDIEFRPPRSRWWQSRFVWE